MSFIFSHILREFILYGLLKTDHHHTSVDYTATKLYTTEMTITE